LAGMSPQEFETLKYLLQKMLSNAPHMHCKSWPLQHGNVLEK